MKIKEKIKTTIKNLSPNQKVIISAVGIMVLLVIILSITHMNKEAEARKQRANATRLIQFIGY